MLRAEEVSYSYESATGIETATFEAAAGSLIALTGPNGSGKSTLIKLIARVLQPQRGEIVFDGKPLRDWNARAFAQVTGYLPQEPDASFPMRAIDIVASGRAPFLTRFGWESESDYAIAAEALALCDVTHLSDRYLDEMSGGERKRVFLARVLAGKPRLVLLDEPLAALDVAHVQQFSRLLRQIVDQTGATIIFASHDLNWAAAYSDRVIVTRAGSIAADVAAADLMRPDLIRHVFGFDARTVIADGRTWIVPAL